MRHPEVPRGPARHLRRPHRRPGGRLSARARASPRSSCCRCTAFVHDRHLIERGLRNYWGYNTIGFFAPASRVSRRRRARRGQDLRPGDARRRHRGHPGRGLQPHRRGQPAGADPLLPRHRQPLLLLSDGGRRAPLQRLHRHRQRAGAAPSLRAAHGHRLAPLLGRGDAGRRLPLRPRDHARAGRGALRRATRASSMRSPRTRCWQGSS